VVEANRSLFYGEDGPRTKAELVKLLSAKVA
jgi:hypothetical protein